MLETNQLKAEIARLQKANSELLKQLDFYGRNLLRSKTTGAFTMMTVVEHDCGDRARAAIANNASVTVQNETGETK